MALLEIKDLEVNYGVIKAIKGVSFDVNEGEIMLLSEPTAQVKQPFFTRSPALFRLKKALLCLTAKSLLKLRRTK